MEELFNAKNWIDLFRDRSLWNAAVILLLAIAALMAALYSNNIQQWRSERQERNKWLRWNR